MIERERGNIKFEIVEHIGVLNTSPTGWNKEFNVVKWNDKSEKYDIRDWSPGHERMSRGVTLYGDELKKLVELCTGMFNETPETTAQDENITQEQPEEHTNQAGDTPGAHAAVKVAEDEVPF